MPHVAAWRGSRVGAGAGDQRLRAATQQRQGLRQPAATFQRRTHGPEGTGQRRAREAPGQTDCRLWCRRRRSRRRPGLQAPQGMGWEAPPPGLPAQASRACRSSRHPRSAPACSSASRCRTHPACGREGDRSVAPGDVACHKLHAACSTAGTPPRPAPQPRTQMVQHCVGRGQGCSAISSPARGKHQSTASASGRAARQASATTAAHCRVLVDSRMPA